MMRFGGRVYLLVLSLFFAVTCNARGPDAFSWKVEVGGFLPQEELEQLVGDAAFLARVSREVNRGSAGAATSIGVLYSTKSRSGSQLSVGGLFIEQTWYGRAASGGYGGPFAGFDLGLYNTHVRVAGNDGPDLLGPVPGTSVNRFGVGASLFVGYRFGESLYVRGGYVVLPPAGGVAVTGFFATLGFGF